MYNLVCTMPWGDYNIGDIITDPVEVADILAIMPDAVVQVDAS